MKARILLFVIVVCLFVRTGHADDQIIPPYGSVSEINLFAGEGGLWALTIHKDGSGHVSWGNSPMDYATFPPQTFDFEQVYRAAVPMAKPLAAYTQLFTMSLRQGDDVNVSMYHFETGEMVSALFSKAIQSCDDPHKIAELWQRHPPASLSRN